MTTGLYKKGIVLGIICLFIGAIVIPSISSYEIRRTEKNDEYNISHNCTPPPDEEKKWTVMVYLNGDASDSWGDKNMGNFLNEMEKVGSSDEINIIVQADDYELWNHKTKRFYITQDNNENEITSPLADSDVTEKDSGHPNTLKNFVIWATDEYPADHYALFIHSHGSGWKGVSYDTTNASHMDIPELGSALHQITQHIGRKLDVLSFYSCRMASLEVYYQIKDYVEICVASEKGIGDVDVSFERPLEDLVATPSYSAEDFAQSIVDGSYRVDRGISYHVLLGIYMDKIDMISSKIDKLADSLINITLSKEILIWIGGESLEGSDSSAYTRTIYKMAELFSMFDYPEISDNARELMNIINISIIKPSQKENHEITGHLSGVSICFPIGKSWHSSDFGYDDLAFFKETSWDEFINKYQDIPLNAHKTILVGGIKNSYFYSNIGVFEVNSLFVFDFIPISFHKYISNVTIIISYEHFKITNIYPFLKDINGYKWIKNGFMSNDRIIGIFNVYDMY